MFSIGDRVRTIETELLKDQEVGREGTVIDIDLESPRPYNVEYDVPGTFYSCGAYQESELECIS